MKKIYVGKDELYPYWTWRHDKMGIETEVEVSKEEYEFIKKARNDFRKAQDLLKKKLEEVKDSNNKGISSDEVSIDPEDYKAFI